MRRLIVPVETVSSPVTSSILLISKRFGFTTLNSLQLILALGSQLPGRGVAGPRGRHHPEA
jgi:hypothetical protein